MFSDRIEALTEMLGNLVWVPVGLIAATLFGWMLFKNFHTVPKKDEKVSRAALSSTSDQETTEMLLSRAVQTSVEINESSKDIPESAPTGIGGMNELTP
jgi:hypothetical protein